MSEPSNNQAGPTNWSEVVKFFAEREDRLEARTKTTIEGSVARAVDQFKAFSLEREQQLIHRFEQVEHKLQDHEYALGDIRRRTDRLFVLTDEIRDQLTPTVQELSLRVQTLIKDVETKIAYNEKLCTRIEVLEHENIRQSGESKGFGKSWHLIYLGILALVAVSSLIGFAIKLKG